jgi:signal transduction histidine kinase
METIWLAVPVMLAGWQYGRRGWQAAMAALVVGMVGLGVLVANDAFSWGDFIAMSLGRLGVVALLSYIVMSLVEFLRAEHTALQAANRQLARRAVTSAQLAESRERNRLARELHDTLAHSLTGLSVQLQALERLLLHDPQAARSLLKEAQATVRSGIQESRRAIQALRATPLEDLGLSEALRQLCRRQSERMGVPFTCTVVDLDALDPVTEQSIYRVAEAALANVEQHAAASAVAVSLTRVDAGKSLRLVIEDNGAGFQPDAVGGEHFGLAGMSERAELIGATLSIRSTPGQGTRIELEMREAP